VYVCQKDLFTYTAAFVKLKQVVEKMLRMIGFVKMKINAVKVRFGFLEIVVLMALTFYPQLWMDLAVDQKLCAQMEDSVNVVRSALGLLVIDLVDHLFAWIGKSYPLVHYLT